VHETRLGSVELIPSSGGRFEVSVNGQSLFSKAALGRHAEPGEVLGLVEKALRKGS
jgi:selenoprotein W-related protein